METKNEQCGSSYCVTMKGTTEIFPAYIKDRTSLLTTAKRQHTVATFCKNCWR
jgi:hypothetical protein